MEKISKYSSYVMYALMALSAFFTALVLFGGSIDGDPLETPVYSDVIIRYAYFLVVGSLAAVLGFELYKIVLHPASAKNTLIFAGGMFVFLLIAYLFSDGTPMEIIGYEGSDNIPSMLKVADTGLFTFYILMVGAALSIVGAEIMRFFKS